MTDRDYVLGTHDEEVARLALQHRLWRARALDAWQRAGIGPGQHVIDIGCGPGFATFDLAELVGESGRVTSVDRSRRFLDLAEDGAARRGLKQVATFERDLDEGELPARDADGAWSRWVFAFVRDPRALLEKARDALRPGGALVLHEYFDYRTWKVYPRCPEHDEFIDGIVAAWREAGGEPDIAPDLLRWLPDAGFELRSWRTHVDVAPRGSFAWEWPRSFMEVGLRRLVDIGRVTPARAEELARAMAAAADEPGAFMITPAVLELIAVRA